MWPLLFKWKVNLSNIKSISLWLCSLYSKEKVICLWKFAAILTILLLNCWCLCWPFSSFKSFFLLFSHLTYLYIHLYTYIFSSIFIYTLIFIHESLKGCFEKNINLLWLIYDFIQAFVGVLGIHGAIHYDKYCCRHMCLLVK